MKKNTLFTMLMALLLMLPGSMAMAQKKKAGKKVETTQVTTGAQDRAKWVEWMWKIAYPAVHRNMYEGNQNFDAQGWLVLGFNGHQPECADVYTSTGSLYMATMSFLPLGLPADDPFWTDAAADWTSKKAWQGQHLRKDYKVEY